MFNIQSGSSPVDSLRYTSSLVTPCTKVELSLCSSAKGEYLTQRTSSSFGRVFAVAGLSEWNKLPVSLRHAPSIGSFKTKLKTHLFQIYYEYRILSHITCPRVKRAPSYSTQFFCFQFKTIRITRTTVLRAHGMIASIVIYYTFNASR